MKRVLILSVFMMIFASSLSLAGISKKYAPPRNNLETIPHSSTGNVKKGMTEQGSIQLNEQETIKQLQKTLRDKE